MLQDRYKVLSLLVIALAITASLAVMSMSSPTKAGTATAATNYTHGLGQRLGNRGT